MILTAYVVLSSFFGIVYSERYYPVFPQTFLFLSFAFGIAINTNHPKHSQHYTYFKVLIFAFMIPYLCYFFFMAKKNKTQHRFLLLKKEKKYEEALDTFNALYDPIFYNIFKKTNNNIALNTHKAIILWELKRKEEAIQTISKALEEQPYYHFNWFHLGNMSYGIQDYEKAKIGFEKAYNLKNSFVRAQIKLVEINLKQNNIEEAKNWFHIVNDFVSRTLKKFDEPGGEIYNASSQSFYDKFSRYQQKLQEIEKKLN